MSSFASGGYTGTGLGAGKLAFLHDKELILNKTDTENMLEAVKQVRQTSTDSSTKTTSKWGQPGKISDVLSKSIALVTPAMNAAVSSQTNLTKGFPTLKTSRHLLYPLLHLKGIHQTIRTQSQLM